MLRLDPFELARPESVDEALALLGSRQRAMLVAGGTDLLPKLKRAQFAPELVIALDRIPGLHSIRLEEDALLIGGLVKLRDLERAPELDEFPALRDAVLSVATPLLRNAGTLAGNLLQDTRCHYVDRSKGWREGCNDCLKLGSDGCRVAPGADRCYAALCSDLAPVLATLDAVAVLNGRELPVEELYRDDGIHNHTLDGELLVELRIPRITPSRAVYKKLRMRGSFDFPELGFALRARGDSGQVDLKAAVCAVTPHLPVAVYRGPAADAAAWLDEFCATVKPMDTGFFSPAYRKQILKNFSRQALDELLSDR